MPLVDQDPVDQDIDRFLSGLPPLGTSRAQPAADPVDAEIDGFLASLGSRPPADDEQSSLRAPIMVDPAAARGPAGPTIDINRTIGKRPATLPPRALLPPPDAPVATPEPTFLGKLAAVPGEASKSALTSFVRMQTEPATAAASMVYPEYADTFQAVREHEQQNPILPLADTGELAISDPRWWAQIGGQAIGSAAGLTVAGRTGGAAGFGAAGKAGLASIPEALAEAGSTFNDVLGQTGDQREAFAKATDVYAANMALLGLTNTPLFEQGGKLLRRTLSGAAIEGGQEVGQTAIGNVATGRPALEGAGEAAVAGALAGGGFRAVEGRGAATQPARPTDNRGPNYSETISAASAVDPVDQGIDAFLTNLPPAARPISPQPSADINITNELTGSSGDQKSGTALARSGNQVVAGIDWDTYDGDAGPELRVKWIETKPEFRRQGIARSLIDTLRQEFPNHRLAWSQTSPDGDALRQAVDPTPAQTLDSVDQDIDRFVAALPPVRGTIEQAIVDQFGGQITEDEIAQLAGRAFTPDARPTTAPQVDTLDTGEQQPRLAGAEDVRNQEQPTPEFDAPFSLTPPVAQASAVQRGLLGAPADVPSTQSVLGTPVRAARRPWLDLASEDAVAQGYRGTPKQAATEITRRARELFDAEQTSGAVQRTPKALLQAIRDVGGIHVTDKDLGGELRRLKEFKDPRTVNQIAGVQGVFRRGGLTLDDMAVMLSREMGWDGIDGPGALVDAIEAAAVAAREGRATLPTFNVEHYAAGAGIRPDARWWLGQTARRNQNLTGGAAELQERFARQMEDDLPGTIAAYRERFGKVVDADLAKELAGVDVAQHHQAIHAPSSWLADRVFEAAIAEAEPGSAVVFTGGGPGVGKNTAVQKAAPELLDAADVVRQSAFAHEATAHRMIDEAEAAGHQPMLMFVYTDPVEAYRRQYGRDRVMTIDEHLRLHRAALNTAHAVAPRLGEWAFVLDNSGASPVLLEGPAVDILAGLRDNYPNDETLRDQLAAVAAKAPAGKGARTAGKVGLDQAGRTGEPPPRRRTGSDDPEVLGESFPESLGDAAGGRTTRPAPSRFPIPVRQRAAEGGTRADLDETVGSPTRRIFEQEEPDIPVGAKPAKKPLSESQAVARLQVIFGHDVPRSMADRVFGRQRRTPLPTKAGRFTERMFGLYKIEPQVIRLKRFGDLATFTHELGHDIDFRLFEQYDRPGGGLFADELLRLGENTSPKGATRKIKIAEGVAEYFRLYFPNPETARRAAPEFTRALDAVLADHPAMTRQFADARGVIQGYLGQDLVTRGAARVDFSRRELDEDPRTVTQRLEVAWVDDLADLRRAIETLEDGKPVPYRENAYVLARLARGAAGKASGFLQFGPRRDDGTFLGGSFADAIAPVRGRLQDFSRYLVASRVPELRGRQIETGMTKAEADAIVAKFGSPEFERARNALYAYQDSVLEYAIQGGALSQETAGKIRALNKSYVPFHRLMSDEPRGGVARKIADRTLPVKKIKGSGRDIIDPLESIIKNTHAIVDMVEKNRAMRALVQQATSTTGGGQFIEAIPQPKQATTFVLDQLRGPIRDALRDADLTVKSVSSAQGDYIEVEGQVVNLDELVTVFTPATMSLPGQDLVSVIDRGRRRFYAVNDKALHTAITQIGARPSLVLGALLAKPASALRAGATLTLGFIGRNPVRDTFVATVQSQHGFKPGVDTLRGLFHYLKKDGHYQEFLNSGAAGAALVSGDRKLLQAELRKYASAGKLADHLRDVVAHPIDALRALSEATEVATRLGEFMKATKKEGRTAEGFTRAGLAARDVTLDFSRAGTQGREWNAYAAFLNAQIQGYDRMVQTFRADPVGATIRASVTITLMSVATWILNHDDEEWRELPEWEKSTYWHIPIKQIGGSGWVRIPKPFELGAVFGTVFEKALDHLAGEDPHAFKRLLAENPEADLSQVPMQTAKSFGWGIINAVMPTALMPLLEARANYSTFRDRAIVSPFDMDIEPGLQFNRWTSETGKLLGKALDYSPAKIDHLIYGYGAGLARGVVGGVEGTAKRVFGNNPAPTGGASKMPGVGAFVREVAGSDAESLATFYRKRDALEGAAGSAKRYKAQGATADEQRIRAKHPTLDADRKKFRRAAEDLKDLRDQVDGVFKDRSASSDAKRDKLDRIYEKMVNRARQALGKPALPSRF